MTKSMKTLFLHALLWSFATLAAAQTKIGSFTGSVWDAETNEPLPGAQLNFPTLKINTVTDFAGNFIFAELPVGSHQLSITFIGYAPLTETIAIAAGQNTPLKLKLKQGNTLAIEEVVVTGTLKEGLRTESPVPVEVYTPKFFFKNPTPNLFDAMQTVNGVRPQVQCNICNTGDIHINGMEGPYTMVMIDGLPIVSGLSTVYGLMGIPNSIIDRIEIVKGPASTLYGSEAVGGLINVITKNPAKAPTLNVDLNATSYSEWTADVATRIKTSKVQGLLGANYFHFDKVWDINNDKMTDMTLQKRFSVFNKWSFARDDNRVADVAGRFVTENRWGGQLNWTPNWYGTDSVYGESIKTNRLELIGNYQLPFSDKVMLSYSYNYHDQKSAYGTKIYNANQQIGVAQLTWNHVAGKHDLLTGAAFRYTYYDDNTPITADKHDLKVNQPWHVKLPGIFVQDLIKTGEKSTLLAGIRYDYNSQHGHIVTPRLNYKHTITKGQTLRLSLGNGYRVVNVFSEDHSALTGAREIVVADNLKPERSWNANINYITQIYPSFGFVDLDFTLFYTYFNNKILPDYYSDPKKVFFNNLNGYGTNYGLTLNSNWNFKNGLNIRAGFTAMDIYKVVNDVKTPQLTAPPFSGTWTASYMIAALNLTVDYTGNITSPMHLPVVPKDPRPEMSPWHSIQNLQLTYKVNKKLEIYSGCKNLLNFVPKNPLLRAFDPFNKTANDPVQNPNNYRFDAFYNYAAIQGIRGFVGLRYNVK
jgi:outer membrane receptor for ferrienterochelin and colicins